jgi:hypothetical protein
LLVSGALVLFIFWIAFQMFNIGARFGTLPSWVEALAGKAWSWLTASAGGVLLYWLRTRTKPGAPTPEYLRWILGVSTGLLVAVIGVAVFVVPIVNPLSPPVDIRNPVPFEIDFSFKVTDTSAVHLATDQLVMKPTRPNLLPLRYITRQPTGRFIERIDLPKPNDAFFMILRRKATDSSKHSSTASELCFWRASPNSKVSTVKARFECEEGQPCKMSEDNTGWAQPCPAEIGMRVPWLFSIRSVWAKSARSEGPAAWVVPSLQSLQNSDLSGGSGYTKFTVRSMKLPLKKADVMRYEVSVNGTPVRIDGFLPEELALPYDPDKAIKIDFGLQNLDFKGADSGHDTVGLKIDLLNSREIAQTYDLKLCYVALRSSPPQILELPDGTRFESEARYVQAKNEREYEVFIYSTTDPRNAERRRSQLSKLEWRYQDGSRVHGVTRPSLSDNPNYGVAIGLEQPSGRIRFTFDQATAHALLKWVLGKRLDPAVRQIVAQDSYLYRIGTRDQIQRPCKVEE